mmetsp:Transcript_98892/g.176186  ORF Transcript_98892/g.176186 Transcript_98892/m.176186 type:complete len:203 (-) Transcript_98892:863-1471(-)
MFSLIMSCSVFKRSCTLYAAVVFLLFLASSSVHQSFFFASSSRCFRTRSSILSISFMTSFMAESPCKLKARRTNFGDPTCRDTFLSTDAASWHWLCLLADVCEICMKSFALPKSPCDDPCSSISIVSCKPCSSFLTSCSRCSNSCMASGHLVSSIIRNSLSLASVALVSARSRLVCAKCSSTAAISLTSLSYCLRASAEPSS